MESDDQCLQSRVVTSLPLFNIIHIMRTNILIRKDYSVRDSLHPDRARKEYFVKFCRVLSAHQRFGWQWLCSEGTNGPTWLSER